MEGWGPIGQAGGWRRRLPGIPGPGPASAGSARPASTVAPHARRHRAAASSLGADCTYQLLCDTRDVTRCQATGYVGHRSRGTGAARLSVPEPSA